MHCSFFLVLSSFVLFHQQPLTEKLFQSCFNPNYFWNFKIKGFSLEKMQLHNLWRKLGKIQQIDQLNRTQDKTRQDRTVQDRTGQDRTGQDKTGQNRTEQDRTGLNRTLQSTAIPDINFAEDWKGFFLRLQFKSHMSSKIFISISLVIFSTTQSFNFHIASMHFETYLKKIEILRFMRCKGRKGGIKQYIGTKSIPKSAK